MTERYQMPDTRGLMAIPVLGFLTGLPWDVHAKNFLAALRPSAVREVWGEMKCDAQAWRVTVFLEGPKDAARITKIEQEVQVGLEGGHRHGHDLMCHMIERGVSDLK